MELDEENYSLNAVTDYDTCMTVKSPKKTKDRECRESTRVACQKQMVQQTVSMPNIATTKRKIPLSCIRDGLHAQRSLQSSLSDPVGRPTIGMKHQKKIALMKYSLSKQCIRDGLRFLTNAHKDHIINFVDENLSAALDDMMTNHTNQFEGLHSEQIGSSRICDQKM
jgi:hypothetical protein